MWCSNVYKMASYTVALLKKFAARPGGKGFSLQRGGSEKFSVAKMKFRSSARPDLRITRHGSPACQQAGLPARQPCARAGLAGGSAALAARQPFVDSGLPCRQPCGRATLKEKCAGQNEPSPWAFCPGFFYERRRTHTPKDPERPGHTTLVGGAVVVAAVVVLVVAVQ